MKIFVALSLTILTLLVFLLVGCSPSEEEVAATVETQLAQAMTATAQAAPTDTPMPTDTPIPTNTPTPTITPTSTPNPLADVDLKRILIGVRRFLPGYISVGTVSTDRRLVNSDEPNMPSLSFGVNFANQEFEQKVDFQDRYFGAGGVIIVIYEDLDETLRAYSSLHDKIEGMTDTNDDSGVGEASFLGASLLRRSMTFHRCNTVIYIDIGGDVTTDEIIEYGQRLDTRIQSDICDS